MDGNVIHSLLGTAPKADGKKGGKVDADAFSAAMDDATKTKSESARDNEAMIDDSKNEKKDNASKPKKNQKDYEEALKATGGKPGDRTSSAALRKLMQTNPDLLSVADKQALRVGEFGHEAVAKKAVTTPMPAALLQQPVAHVPAPAAQQAAAESKPTRTDERVAADVASREDKSEEKREKLVKEAAKEGAPTVEQRAADEAKFTQELQKQSATDKAAERQSLIDQILQQIEVRNFANKTELNLKLNPEYLGELKINLVHTDKGVSANFETTSRRTREALQEAEEELRSQAKDKGVRLGALKVTLVDKLA